MTEGSVSIESFLHPRRVVFSDAAFVPRESRNRHMVRIGVIVALLGVEGFFLLPTVLPSQQILPGDWTPLFTSFLVDFMYATLALGAIAALPLVNPRKAANLVLEPGGFAGFTVRYAIFGAAWTAISLGLLFAGSSGGGAIGLTDTQRLQSLVSFGIFVGPAEELFFRCALTEYFGGIASTVVFAVYHSFAYSATYGVSIGLLYAMIEAGVFGAIFLWEYKAFGLSAAIASHTAFDLVSSGTVGLHTLKLGVV